ncbi:MULTISPECIES: cupredoxin domain-containing protein [Acidobacteriaceae]|uniref:cupredoxin domain-containing protein n=1 Tax=Acidobacteriaceae TaxID=204434 RepID=UPI00131B8856|nr:MULTISPECIES: cupredoxin domain-containing protein [Acidobacteriaceae]MDW5265169.1 cupredoxin domain-containing protein [Edaphobacter sp.]
MKKKSLLLTLLIGALMGSSFSAPQAQAQTAPQRIVIIAKRFSYNPGEITLKKGQPVALVLKSEDVAHGLRFRDFNVTFKVKAGGTEEVRFTPDKTGDFIGHCSVFCGSGHGSMSLKLHVVE